MSAASAAAWAITACDTANRASGSAVFSPVTGPAAAGRKTEPAEDAIKKRRLIYALF
jgi:hypothetical protein